MSRIPGAKLPDEPEGFMQHRSDRGRGGTIIGSASTATSPPAPSQAQAVVRGHEITKRRMVRYESVITAVIGGLLGIGVGLVFAFLVTQSLDDLGLGFSVPSGQLVVFLLLAVVVGVAAAVVPARRGARLQVLEAMRAE